jgi:hypothetical protein
MPDHAFYEPTRGVNRHFVLHIQGHGFRKELIHMLMDLRPQFVRFPGISYAIAIKIN